MDRYVSHDENIEFIKSADERIKKSENLGLKTQHEYENIMNEAASIRLSKVLEYGEERYDDPDLEFNLWMLLCDVNRKVSRFRRLTKEIINNINIEPENVKKLVVKLRSDYIDLANYGLMGAQIIDRLKIIDKINGIIESKIEKGE